MKQPVTQKHGRNKTLIIGFTVPNASARNPTKSILYNTDCDAYVIRGSNIRKRLKTVRPGNVFSRCFNFNPMIYYIVYLSAATRLYSDVDINEILTVSRRNNTKKDVSGILLYHDGCILQVLEGNQPTVTDLYLKIKGDKRHKDAIALVQGACEERSFSDWSMGFKAVNRSDWNEYEGYMKTDTAGLLSLIKQKNPKIDVTVKSFVTRTMQR